jgi:hypothetical protein
MSDLYKGFDPHDAPTMPIRVPGAAPSAPGGKGPGDGGWSRGKRVAALLAACAVVGGGAFAVVQATTGSPVAAQSTAAQSATAQTGTQAGSAVSATEQATALRDAIATPGIRRLARLRLLGGMYGQFTYETKKGPRTLAFERGTITSAGNGNVVIRAADGTTFAWVLTSTSVVREDGTKEPEGSLAQGQTVFAGGLVTSGTRDARLIVIRKAGTTQKTSSTA